MNCYHCGCRLSEKDFCTACGADVSTYKKIMSLSNRYYNDGLEKAGVRDLTGAIVSLRQSLKCNKNNIEARNLLGLVYYEMGEVVSALSEWVISKNLKADKNIADDYINMIQSNQGHLDTINQTIKKYNQALAYCHQDSLDLAVIQLKKVLSLNPRYVKAHQLLALLYMNMEEWEKAERELIKCQKIDAGNITTMRYQKETKEALAETELPKNAVKGKNKHSGEAVRYQSGNEIIIQPVDVKEFKGVSTLLNIGIGLLLGLAVACFLILPAQTQNAGSEARAELATVREQLDLRTATIGELEQRIDNLTQENTTLTEQLATYVGEDGALQAVDILLQAADAYIADSADTEGIAEYLEQVDAAALAEKTEAFQQLYRRLIETVGPAIAESYYNAGYESYRRELYEEAIPNLEKAFEFNPENGEALLYLGNCFNNLSDTERAVEIYNRVVELFEGTERARRAQTYLNELTGE